MHREHAPRLQLEYRIREDEGERERGRQAEQESERRGVVGGYRFQRLCNVTVEGYGRPFFSAFLSRPSSAF